MKKNIIISAIIALLMIFAACASAPPPVEPAPRQDPPPQVELPPPPQGDGIILGNSLYTVVSGDTLSIIASRRYGQANMFYFPLIRLANILKVSDPDVLEVGETLIIPDLQANLNNPVARALIKADMLQTATMYDRKNMPNSASQLRTYANRL